MTTLDHKRFYKALKQNKIQSVLELARQTGLHRNTINHYLKGASLHPQGFQIICHHLGLSVDDLIQRPPQKNILSDNVAKIVDQLHKCFPIMAFVLFGSRARGRYKKYSDWDIGFFSYQKVTHQTHLDVLKKLDDLTENITEDIELVNLNQADQDFLMANRDDFVFLTGSLVGWYAFKKILKQYERS